MCYYVHTQMYVYLRTHLFMLLGTCSYALPVSLYFFVILLAYKHTHYFRYVVCARASLLYRDTHHHIFSLVFSSLSLPSWPHQTLFTIFFVYLFFFSFCCTYSILRVMCIQVYELICPIFTFICIFFFFYLLNDGHVYWCKYSKQNTPDALFTGEKKFIIEFYNMLSNPESKFKS